MNANELRIGNLIKVISVKKVFEDFVTEVKGYDIVRIEENSFNNWNYEAIPLTEEWLLKFGFENIRFKYEINSFIIWLDPRSTYYYINHEGGNIEIQNVHQLQNLYFALTNNELTL